MSELNHHDIPDLDVSLHRNTSEEDTAEEDLSWYYRGPAAYGPKEVRTSGRGPYWMGSVSDAHANQLIRRAKKLGYTIKSW